MGFYKHIRDLKKNNPEKLEELRKKRLVAWRQEPVTKRIDKPTKLDKARSLGYKAKQGVFVVRQRVSKGGRQRPQFKAGRRSKHMRRKKVVHKNYQQVAEERVARKYDNCEVLNSYKVLEDGHKIWFEVIMIDRFHPEVINDDDLRQASSRKGKVFRGLTSSGRKSRGQRGKKGKGTEKTRPSKNSGQK